MEDKKKIIIGLGIIVVILLINFIGANFLGKWFYFDNRPECYISTQDKCMNGYDLRPLYFYSTIPFYQCCLKPHYLLQGLDTNLRDYSWDFYYNYIENSTEDGD